MTFSDQHDCIAPIDARYWDEETASYLSDRAFLRYKLMIEAALASQLAARGLCDPQIATEIVTACTNLGFFPGEVDTEEQRVHHDVRAMVNCLQHRVSEQARPFVHLCATSYDIVDTANALRFRDATQLLLVPHLSALAAVLTRQAEQYRNTVQVGRTHGQHAVPITFGFALAGYSSRLTGCLEHLSALAKELPGKFSGAVGAYNALSLIVADPLEFERELLSGLGLSALSPTTQIVQPEPRIRLLLEVCLAAGIMADLSDDMRHLQRSEIAEVGEEFATGAVGSSTMPQKRNPISFENAKAMWKVL
ncbi:adenylosuccinate lyase, partial [Patescibacteria group bacterium]|nr:adenylosuccinate lyase [Patescibacteria group bacterium]